MVATQLVVSNVGKAYRSYRTEWARVGSWFGLHSNPAKESWVLRSVSFSVSSGEAIAIIGQNGAGKSTLLKLITGVMQPTEGSISCSGRVAAILELGLGFNPEFTARENVRHSAGLMGFSSAQIESAMPEIEAFAEIGSYFDQPMRTYSSGMQMRVAFSVATAWRPDVLIVDEALSVGDAFFQAKCYERVSLYRSQGMSLLLVTHSVGDVVRLCDRALLLRSGELVVDGEPREVTNQYLDDLFGKRSRGGDQARSPANLAIQEKSDLQDVFASRPGYRKDEHRWGHGGAAIIDYSIVVDGVEFPAQIDGGAKARFYFKVRYLEEFRNVVPGILFKSLEGIFLYGTNSFLASEGKQRHSANRDETQVYSFDVPMMLNAGSYLVSFGISTGITHDSLTPLDRRYDSVVVNVSRQIPFLGIVDLAARTDQVA